MDNEVKNNTPEEKKPEPSGETKKTFKEKASEKIAAGKELVKKHWKPFLAGAVAGAGTAMGILCKIASNQAAEDIPVEPDEVYVPSEESGPSETVETSETTTEG